MTTAEVRDGLVNRFPSRTIAVSEVAWYHGHIIGERYVEYTISVQPGFDGLPNQNFSDDSLEACLVKLNNAAPKE